MFGELFGTSSLGQLVSDRISAVMSASSSPQRAGGGQDAYFLVRDPSPSAPAFIEDQATRWLHRLHDLVSQSSLHMRNPLPFGKPSVRVLEGLPPKQLKSDEEAIPLLRWLKRDAGQVTQGLAGDCVIHELFREACYFIACDAMLRDYVLWPTYRLSEPTEDPFSNYFELWRRGVKWRVFQEDTVDIYLPRA